MKNPAPVGKRDDDVDFGTRPRPVDPYRNRSQTYRAARRLRHRNPVAEVLPSRYQVTIDAEAPVSPGYGVLRIETEAKDVMPVFAVNGEPVAMGQGTIRVSVPEGTYCVESQSSAGVDPVIVTVRDRAELPLYFWEHRINNELYFGSVKRKFRNNTLGMSLIVMFFFSVLCCAPFGVISYFSDGDSAEDVATPWFMGAITLVFTALLPYGIIRNRRDKANRKEDAKRLAQPMHSYPWGEPPLSSTPVLVGAQRRELPPPDPSLGALLMYFSLDRHLWPGSPLQMERAGDLARLWIEPPRIRIDGVEHVATWGTWWYPLGQGKHTVEVGVEGMPSNAQPPMLVEHMTGKASSATFEISPRTVTPMVAEAHTYAVKRSSGIEIFQPRLWVEPSRTNHFSKVKKRP